MQPYVLLSNETASKRESNRASTAALPVRECMLMSNGWKMWSEKAKRKSRLCFGWWGRLRENSKKRTRRKSRDWLTIITCSRRGAFNISDSMPLSTCHHLVRFSSLFKLYPEVSGEKLPESTLQLVQIYFDTATFEDIERDKKIKFEAQLSLIGGTMGLLTGFSIISGVEIIFFIFRFPSLVQ